MEGKIIKDNSINYNNKRYAKRQTPAQPTPSQPPIQQLQQQDQQEQQEDQEEQEQLQLLQQQQNYNDQIYPHHENFQPNGNNSNNNSPLFCDDNQKQRKEIQLWCKALKITSEQFFAMPDEELKLRINNLKGRLRLKVAKNLIAYQKNKIEELMNYQNLANEVPDQITVPEPQQPLLQPQPSRFRGGSHTEPIIRDRANNRLVDSGNIWDILYRAAADVEGDDLDLEGDCCDEPFETNSNFYDTQNYSGDGQDPNINYNCDPSHYKNDNFDCNSSRVREALPLNSSPATITTRGYTECKSEIHNLTELSSDYNDEGIEEQLTQQSNFDEKEEVQICDAASGPYINQVQSSQRVQPTYTYPQHPAAAFDSISEERTVNKKNSYHRQKPLKSMNLHQNSNTYYQMTNSRSVLNPVLDRCPSCKKYFKQPIYNKQEHSSTQQQHRHKLEQCPSCQNNVKQQIENRNLANGVQYSSIQYEVKPRNNRKSDLSYLDTKKRNYSNCRDKTCNSQPYQYPSSVRKQSSTRQLDRNRNLNTLYSANRNTENGIPNGRNYVQHQNQCTNNNFDPYD